MLQGLKSRVTESGYWISKEPRVERVKRAVAEDEGGRWQRPGGPQREATRLIPN